MVNELERRFWSGKNLREVSHSRPLIVSFQDLTRDPLFLQDFSVKFGE